MIESRTLIGCLLASLALHGVLLLVLPGWWRIAPPEVPATLDVVLMPADIAEAPSMPSSSVRKSPVIKQATPAPVIAANAVPASSEFFLPVKLAVTDLPVAVQSNKASVLESAATNTTARAEPVLTPPAFSAAYLRNPPPQYPPTARRSGDEGTVLLRVLVAADGAAARVEVDRTSGSSLLDGAALDAVRDWRFVPARRGTQNVEDWVRVPVVFRLES